MDKELQEDWLDARLRDEMPYVDDEGFTARVMQRLPTREVRRSFRALLLCCITLLASAISYLASDGAQFLVSSINRVAGLPLLWILILSGLCGLVLTSVAATAAFTTARHERFE